MTIFDTSSIEAFVTENNPKYSNRIINQLKTYKKVMQLDDSYDPYKAAYKSMPTCSASNQNIKLLYINGHFCYVFKFGLITNGLGIVHDISFYNKDSLILTSFYYFISQLPIIILFIFVIVDNNCYILPHSSIKLFMVYSFYLLYLYSAIYITAQIIDN